MSINSEVKRVVVIGAGPGGYAAAFKCSDLGMQVTLIDLEENPGGVCLFRGCIPSKALLHVAKIVREANEAENWGVFFQNPKIDIPKLQGWKQGIVDKLTQGLGQLSRSRKVTFIQGRAQFLGSQRVKIIHRDGKEESLSTDYTILATGSSPTEIPGISTETENIMDSTAALRVDEIPKSLLVIGGGYIGLELGSVYNGLGSKVTVVEMTNGLLPGADRDLVAILQKQLENQSVKIRLNTKVLSIRKAKRSLSIEIQGQDGKKEQVSFEKVLFAVGRKPNSQNLGLQKTRVEVDSKGFVKVNPQRKTTDNHIFAIGDVAGEPMLAHKASHEGFVAAEAIYGHKSTFNPQAIPAVVFTDPEIAWCGLTELEAKKAKFPTKVVKFPWGASGRAMTLGPPIGLTKLILEANTERVLGVGICGANAGDLIAEGALAIEMAALASDLKLTIHPHPTLSETIMEAAELVSGSSTHIFRPKRKTSQR